MKNIKQMLAITLAVTLFTATNISAMFGTNKQVQPQPQPQTTQSIRPFGAQPQQQSEQKTFNFGQPTQTEQPKTFSFGQPSQPQKPTFNFAQPTPTQTQTAQPKPFGFPQASQQPIFPQISNTPLLQAYFNPQDQLKITSTLFDLLDNAKKQIYIAIYWITDKIVIEKIIAAKKRNVDVQIVIDESSPEIDNIIAQLLQNNIIPIIYPSGYVDAAGKMHHKFIAVDDMTILTGSANFTQVVLNPNIERFNFENVIIINSSNIAKQFFDAFVEMQKEICDFYVDIIALNNQSNLPQWMHRLIPTIYQQQYSMQQSVKQLTDNSSPVEQSRINNFFGIQPIVRQSLLTEKQERILRNKGFSNQEILKLSKQQGSQLIGAILSNYNWERATEKQQALLRDKGFSDQDILFLSKDEASDLISQVIARERQQNRW